MTTMHLSDSPVALVIAGCSLVIVPERNWSLSFAYYLNLRHFDGRNHLILRFARATAAINFTAIVVASRAKKLAVAAIAAVIPGFHL